MNRVYIQSHQLKHQEPIKEKDPVDLRNFWLILLTFCLVVLGVFSYIWRNVEIISLGYRMRTLYEQRALLQDQRQKLLLEQASLRSMKRIETIASSDLNLVKPNPDQLIILPDHGVKVSETQNDLQ